MLARVDGQVVLVADAIPGERVLARVERLGKGVAFARATSIETPSPDRRDPLTDPACGGCLYAHIAYARQLELKAALVADAFARIGRIPLTRPVRVAASPEEGYRMRARLHVRDGRIGFFREGTHALCDARATRQLRSESCDALDGIESRLRVLGASTTGEIDVSENVAGTERALHIAADGPGETWRGDSELVRLATNPYVTDRLSILDHEVVLRRHVLSFFQGNRYLLADLLAHVLDRIVHEVRVIDLYAGVGLFAVGAAVARHAEVTAVEGDRMSTDDLQANTAASADRVRTVRDSVEGFLAGRPSAPDVAIVDPPRTGMSREAMEGVVRLGARTVLYVSCDVATLARDARRLLDNGYAIADIRGFDFFPNTPHVETVVTFEGT